MLLATLVALSLCTQSAAPGRPLPLPPSRPNILLVLLDDIGVDQLEGYGLANGVYGPTPVLDGLMAVGTRFEHAYASPVCSPTRLSVLTGEYPHRYGVGNSIQFTGCAPELTPPVDGSYLHLPQLLRNAGYRTAALGKWHMATQCNGAMQHPLLVGYETHRGSAANLPDYFAWEKWVDGRSLGITTTYATTDTANEAIDLIRLFGDDPWFVAACFNAPHLPFHVPPAELKRLGTAGAGGATDKPPK